jgi:hypothetical protein
MKTKTNNSTRSKPQPSNEGQGIDFNESEWKDLAKAELKELEAEKFYRLLHEAFRVAAYTIALLVAGVLLWKLRLQYC